MVTWGAPEGGGGSRAVLEQLRNVRHIQATGTAFAAVLDNGSVVTWGAPEGGGDSSAVLEQLRSVQHIQATGTAFAAIRHNGSVVTWGAPEGGGGDSSAVENEQAFASWTMDLWSPGALLVVAETAAPSRSSSRTCSTSRQTTKNLLLFWQMDPWSPGAIHLVAVTAAPSRSSSGACSAVRLQVLRSSSVECLSG